MARTQYLASKPRYEISHLPFVYLQMAWMRSHPEAPTGTVVMLAVCVFIVSVGVAYASLRLYDVPVRRWLTEKWLKRA